MANSYGESIPGGGGVNMERGDGTAPDPLTLGSSGWPARLTGMVAILIGVLAIVFPLAASIGVGITIGLLLAASGVVELVRVFRMRRAGRIACTTAFGLLSVTAGALMVVFPALGIFSLTVLLVAYFLIAGIVKAVAAWQMRSDQRWLWLVISSVISLALGILLWIALPQAMLWAVGLLFGIDAIFFGMAQLMMSRKRGI